MNTLEHGGMRCHTANESQNFVHALWGALF